MHDGSHMRVKLSDDRGALEIYYLDPPAMLRENGVKPDTVLVRGHWEKETLVGEAYVFPVGCAPIAYPIRGLVDVSYALVVLGPVPNVTAACEVSRYEWTEGSVMRFEALGSLPAKAAKSRKKAEPKKKAEPEPKAKAKPKPKPRPRPVAPAQPSYPQPWRWF